MKEFAKRHSTVGSVPNQRHPYYNGEEHVVKLQEIDRTLFEKLVEEKYRGQEALNQLIIEALAVAEKDPKRYAEFKMLILDRNNWKGYMHRCHMKAYARHLGGKIANWVEFALWMAWRISNGESWESICDNAGNKDNWYRVIVWKDNGFMVVFGYRVYYHMTDRIIGAMPVVTIR